MKESPRSSRSSSSPSHLVVGRVGRAVGLKGEVEVAVVSDDPGRFAKGSVVIVAKDLERLTLANVRKQGDRTIVAFEEVTDRDGAEALRGKELVIESTHARPLDEGEYWDHDLIGCAVVTTDGSRIGEVVDVLHQAGGEILVVRGERDHLVPLIADVVRAVEPSRLITIAPLPGLLDD